MGKVLLSIGHGFSASVLGAHLIKDGWTVYGTTRSVEKAKKLNNDGVNSIIWPGTNLTPYIQKATHILTSVSPNSQGDPVLDQYNGYFQKILLIGLGIFQQRVFMEIIMGVGLMKIHH